MDPLPDVLVVGASIAAIVVALGAAAMAMFRPRTGRYVPDEQLISFGVRLDAYERRLGRFEESVKETQHSVQSLRMTVPGLATKDSVNALAVEMGKLAGEVRAATHAFTATANSVERVERFLMEATAAQIARGDRADDRSKKG